MITVRSCRCVVISYNAVGAGIFAKNIIVVFNYLAASIIHIFCHLRNIFLNQSDFSSERNNLICVGLDVLNVFNNLLIRCCDQTRIAASICLDEICVVCNNQVDLVDLVLFLVNFLIQLFDRALKGFSFATFLVFQIVQLTFISVHFIRVTLYDTLMYGNICLSLSSRRVVCFSNPFIFRSITCTLTNLDVGLKLYCRRCAK